MSARNIPHTPKDIFDYMKEREVAMVDLRFCDLLGAWHHFTVPSHELSVGAFEDGFAFDGSSIRGWRASQQSDMQVVPDPLTAQLDPFMETPTLALVGDIRDPVTGHDDARDPRSVARRAEAYLRGSGIAEKAFFGPEAQFFIFDDVRFKSGVHEAFYAVDSAAADWNSGREEFPNLAYKVRAKGGYVPLPPTDTTHDLRSQMCLALQDVGITVERHHMGVATGGQAEIDIRYDSLLRQADKMCWFKYIIKNIARRAGKVATFMPKPLFEDNGSGMHVHMSLWRETEPLFAGNEYAGMSKMAMQFMAGILQHAPALCAFTNPSTNSYKRLVPGSAAPVNLAYSSRNRSTSIRIPAASVDPRAARIEFRTPDPSANPYLAFSALLMAGLDGIRRGLEPGQPMDQNLDNLPPEALKDLPKVPGSLGAALQALAGDHEFLLHGDVFSLDLIHAWMDWKRVNEVSQIDRRPHPHEFALYFDT